MAPSPPGGGHDLVKQVTGLTWAALIVSVLLVELGALFGLNQWIVDATPFAHVP